MSLATYKANVYAKNSKKGVSQTKWMDVQLDRDAVRACGGDTKKKSQLAAGSLRSYFPDCDIVEVLHLDEKR